MYYLDGVYDSQGCGSGSDSICPGIGILCIGGGKYENLTRYREEQTGSLIVVILDALYPHSAVKGDGQAGQSNALGVTQRDHIGDQLAGV